MLVFYYGMLVETNVLNKRKPHLQHIIQTVYDVGQFINLFPNYNYKKSTFLTCNDVFIYCPIL